MSAAPSLRRYRRVFCMQKHVTGPMPYRSVRGRFSPRLKLVIVKKKPTGSFRFCNRLSLCLFTPLLWGSTRIYLPHSVARSVTPNPSTSCFKSAGEQHRRKEKTRADELFSRRETWLNAFVIGFLFLLFAMPILRPVHVDSRTPLSVLLCFIYSCYDINYGVSHNNQYFLNGFLLSWLLACHVLS